MYIPVKTTTLNTRPQSSSTAFNILLPDIALSLYKIFRPNKLHRPDG